MTGIRSTYLGGPLDGRVDILPALDDGPARTVELVGIDPEVMVATWASQRYSPRTGPTGGSRLPRCLRSVDGSVSTGVRLPLIAVVPVAEGLIRQLLPGCERIEVAGSIRRGRPDVGDIELVAIPRTTTEPDGLFDSLEVSELDRAVDALVGDGELICRALSGT